MEFWCLITVLLVTLTAGRTLKNPEIPVYSARYSKQLAELTTTTTTTTTLPPFTPSPAAQLTSLPNFYQSESQGKERSYDSSFRRLGKYSNVFGSANANTRLADTTHAFIDVMKVKQPNAVSETSEHPPTAAVVNIVDYNNNVTRINKTLSGRIGETNTLASFPGGFRYSNVSLAGGESRSRLSGAPTSRTKKFRRRGKAIGRFTGLSRPVSLLPPGQRREPVKQIALYNIPGSHSTLTPNIRARKAKIRFTRKRMPSKENGHHQELVEPVSVTKRPLSLTPFTFHPQHIADMVEFGRKNMKTVEELSQYTENKENNTHYPKQMLKFLGPTLEIRKYTISDNLPHTVIVRHKGETVQAPRVTPPQVKELPVEPKTPAEQPRPLQKVKSRRIKSRAGKQWRQSGVASPSWPSDARNNRHYVAAVTPSPARTRQRQPQPYFPPSEPRARPPWRPEQSYNYRSQISTKQSEGVSTTLKPPPHRTTERRVSNPATSTESNEATTPTTTRPVRKKRPSPRRARQPRPPVHDIRNNQVSPRISDDLSSQIAAVTSFTCAGRPAGHHADMEAGCKVLSKRDYIDNDNNSSSNSSSSSSSSSKLTAKQRRR
ncbi:hypothetical protein E2C01_040387 [Portunus trituberculatus]|uniref:Uncharacterized protein n=1 Tax=Portunus trituberculatus TaxID=210409 RepID=A0A5B7FJK4_PORTR|nr:hypothetical protein [Portunus trituberculatus]